MMILVSVLALGVLIFVHELGHFLVAKWRGIGVLEFAIGFGPKIFSWRSGDTTYSLRVIPLGGFVRMVGDTPDDIAALEQGEGLEEIEDESEKALLTDKSKWFLLKGYWSKVAVVAAGPAANILFAFLLSVGSFWVFGASVPLEIPKIGDVIPGQPAEKAGFKPGDLVKTINGEAISTWEQLATTIGTSEGKELLVIVSREGEPAEVEVRVKAEREGSEVEVVRGVPSTYNYKVGITASFGRESVSIGEAVISGGLHVYRITEMTLRGLGGMIRGLISPTHIAGPLFIFNEAARSAKKGIEYLFDFMIFLSMSLAILNLLPIPVLDGGHLLLFTIEKLKGGPLSTRTQMVATQVGLVFLLLLTVFAVGNDIRRLF